MGHFVLPPPPKVSGILLRVSSPWGWGAHIPNKLNKLKAIGCSQNLLGLDAIKAMVKFAFM